MTRNSPQDNPALLELKTLLAEPDIDLAKFYKKHGNLVLQITAALLYLAAAALLLFASTALVAVALGLTIGAAVINLWSAVADFYRYRQIHTLRVMQVEQALKILSPGQTLTDPIKKLNDNRKLSSKWSLGIPYPWLSLGVNVASSLFLIAIAALNLSALIASSAFASPILLVGLLVANLVLILLKDLIINKAIKAVNKHLKELSADLATHLSDERLNLLKPEIPNDLQPHIKAPLTALRTLINNRPLPAPSPPPPPPSSPSPPPPSPPPFPPSSQDSQEPAPSPSLSVSAEQSTDDAESEASSNTSHH